VAKRALRNHPITIEFDIFYAVHSEEELMVKELADSNFAG